MSETYADAKLERLRLSGFTEGTVSDRWSDYLRVSIGWQPGDSEHVSDMTGLWLEQQGAIGSTLNDLWHDFLGQQGFDLSDALPDRLLDWWNAEVPLP